jgi:hypothetical protein
MLEMKLDRSFVGLRGADQRGVKICKLLLISLTPSGRKWSVSVSRSADIDQGFVFAQPMYQDAFIKLLRARKAK